jgi:arsenate reductase-like glutaredoxin family protein
MPLKRATYLTWGEDEQCADTRRFIENAGVLLDVRDLSKQPLSVVEIDKLIGHVHIDHFLNPMSATYAKHEMDKKTPTRNDMIRLIAEDYTLLRRPIIRNNRLFTIGCDKRKIAEMLQISMNGKPNDDDRENGVGQHQPAGANK